jgi:hypothetical protein
MATYQLRLTPELRSLADEGSLDTSVMMVANPNTAAGQPAMIPVSAQRSGYMTTAASGVGQDVKVTEMKDGEEFTDTLQTITDVIGVVSST